MKSIIVDTNIFIAASFNHRSSSAMIIDSIKQGAVELIWDEKTKAETKKLLDQIPRTRWEDFAGLFKETNKHDTNIPSETFAHSIKDPDDRKFAALAKDSGATIITNDDHLLGTKGETGLAVVTPREYTSNYLL
jgi:putative PIN family toxin of toxin-antitoxin system